MAATLFKKTSPHKKVHKYKELQGTCSDDEESEQQEQQQHHMTHTSLLLPHYEQVVERPVRRGETLQSISVNYRISIYELKRINRLQKESDFFALNIIKIPIKPNSALGDILIEEEEKYKSNLPNGSSSHGTSKEDSSTRRPHLSSCTTNDTDSDPDTFVGYVSIHQILREKSTRKEARRFLENMQADLNRIRDKVVINKSSLIEAAEALTDPSFVPLPAAATDAQQDWGLSWWRLFCIAILLLLALPIAYLIYMFNFE